MSVINLENYSPFVSFPWGASKIFPGSLTLLYFSLAIASSVGVSMTDPVRVPLPLFLWFNTFVAAVRTYFVNDYATSTWDISTLCMFIAFSMIFLQLFVRLVTSNFGGKPWILNFGTKCRTKSGDFTCAPNDAFSIDFPTFGHTIQGMFSILLFPHVRQQIMKISRSSPLAYYFTELGSLVVIIYPIYNALKRVIVYGTSTFSLSSWCNNQTEWAFGFWVGLELGTLFGIFVAVDQKPEVSLDMMKVRMGGALLLTISAVLTALVMGLSWNKTDYDDMDSEDDMDISIAAIFLGLPGLCLCAICMIIAFTDEILEEKSDSEVHMTVQE